MVSPRTIEQTLAEFDDPRIAAVGIPFINVRKGSVIHQQAPDTNDRWICEAYVGASHALRRDVFLAAGGYREDFFYMGEEGDLCVRLLDKGYVVRLGRAAPISMGVAMTYFLFGKTSRCRTCRSIWPERRYMASDLASALERP